MELARWLDVILIPVVFASIFVFAFDERLGDTKLFVRVMAGLFCGLVSALVFGLVSELIAATITHHASALINENIYAGAVLMLLPLALERGDWLLGAGLLWSLLWTRSEGAWLGLAGALAITRRQRLFQAAASPLNRGGRARCS